MVRDSGWFMRCCPSATMIAQPDIKTLAGSHEKSHTNLRQLYERGAHGREEFFFLDKYFRNSMML
jgi:hypothetical protein